MQDWNRAAIDRLKQELGGAPDLVTREIPSAGTTVLFLENLVDPQRTEDRLIGRLVAAGAPRGDAAGWLSDTVAASRIAAVGTMPQAARPRRR